VYRTEIQTSKSETNASDYFAAFANFDIADLKILANKRDVSYQLLLKVFLAERLEQERRRI